MTDATSPAPQRTRMSTGAKVVLGIGIAILVLLIAGAAVTIAMLGFGRTALDTSESVDAGSSVEVSLPNATLVVLGGTDESVTVEVEGLYLFEKPVVTVATSGGVTRIDGGCPTVAPWSAACSMTVTITLPESIPVTIAGLNGDVTATGLTGDLEIGTTNGSIDLDGSAGDLELRTTNGSISVGDSESSTVVAVTVNGEITLEFADSPTDVQAAGTNGSITIEVPDAREAYAIDLGTVNGDTETVKVVNDPQADRSISAHTVNGSVTVTAP